MTIRLNDQEFHILEALVKAMGCSKSEVFRRLIWMADVLFNKDANFVSIVRPLEELKAKFSEGDP